MTSRSISLEARSPPRTVDPKIKAASTRLPRGASASRIASCSPAVLANSRCSSGKIDDSRLA